MDKQLANLIAELHVLVFYSCLDAPGHVVFPDILNGKAVIYINSDLSECEQRTVLIHELGHVAKQRDEKELYDVTMNMKLKMEYGANRFMISYLFKNYIQFTGDEPRSVNYLDFMRQNDIPDRDEGIVKEIIANF